MKCCEHGQMPFSQTYGEAEKASQGQTLCLFFFGIDEEKNVFITLTPDR
jgi:hypothetical protein